MTETEHGNAPYTEPSADAVEANRRLEEVLAALRAGDAAAAWKVLDPETRPPAPPPDLGALADGAEALADAADGSPAKALDKLRESLPPAPLPVVSTWDTSERPPEREWLSPGWIPSGRLTLFTGKGGGGKSLAALQLAVAVASEHPHGPDVTDPHRWPFGEPTRPAKAPTVDRRAGPGRVLFLGWEDEEDEIRRRLHWTGADGRALGDRLRYVALEGLGPLWGPEQGKHESTAADVLAMGKRIEAEIERAAGDPDEPLRLVVVDPAAAAYSGNENARALVRQFVGWLGALARRHGPAVVLVAHPPKSESDYSGSTDWRNGARSVLTLEAEDTGTGKPPANGKGKPAEAKAWRIRRGKANYAREGSFAWLAREVQHVHEDGKRRLDVLRWAEASKEDAADAYRTGADGQDWPDTEDVADV